MTATFQITTIDVSTSASSLASLSGREYNSEYTALPNANLPKTLRSELDTVFQFLTGEELPLEENTFLIKARDGIYFRGIDEGTLYTYHLAILGNQHIPAADQLVGSR